MTTTRAVHHSPITVESRSTAIALNPNTAKKSIPPDMNTHMKRKKFISLMSGISACLLRDTFVVVHSSVMRAGCIGELEGGGVFLRVGSDRVGKKERIQQL